MYQKSLICIIMLMLCCGIANAQEPPITLEINYGSLLRPSSFKDWDGTADAEYINNLFIIDNESDIVSGDEVSVTYVAKYEKQIGEGTTCEPISEPGEGYFIWAYISLEGKDAGKYTPAVSSKMESAHGALNPLYYEFINETKTIRLLLADGTAEIEPIRPVITGPTGTYTYGESEIHKDIKATLDGEYEGYFEYLVETASGFVDIAIGKMLDAGNQVLKVWYRFLEATHYIPNENPVQSTVTVKAKEIDFTGEIVINSKPKDGTTDVLKAQILQMPELQGIIEGDDVQLTIDYDQTKYPSAAPGEYEINVHLKLSGKQAGNYILTTTEVKTKTKITEFEKQKLEFDGDFVILPKYFDNSDIIYQGEVVAPKFKNLVEGDKVEIVVDYTKTKFPESTIGKHLVRIYFTLGGDDAFKYTLSETSKMEYGEITGFNLNINTEPNANGVYQLTYTQSQLGEDLRITNPRNENETVKYLIDGEDATKKMLTAGSYTVKAIMYQYEQQVTECEWKVNVKKLKLKVSEPQILHTKVYDGTTSVALSGDICQIINSLTTDNVAIISQTQEYDNPSIGSNKKITVSFVLSGDLTDKYIAPDNVVFNDGVITPGKIEVSNISTIKTEYCQGDEIKFLLTISEGLPESAHISFDATAQANGFTDLDIEHLTVESETERSFTLQVPDNAAAGTYKGEISFTDPLGTISQKYNLEISVMYQNSIIKTKFTDVVFIDNAEGKFAEYQWYKDNKKIDGATMQFYNDKNGISGLYSAVVKTTDGKSFKVCGVQINDVKVATTKSLAPKAEIYPNPAKASQPINIRLVNFSEIDINAANLYIFNSLGNKVLQQNNLTEEFSIVLPKGNYTMAIIYNQQRISYKLIVND